MKKIFIILVCFCVCLPYTNTLAKTGETTVYYKSIFPEITKHRVLFTSGNNGQLRGETAVYIQEGHSLSIEDIPTPIPNSGYIFDKWFNVSVNPPQIVTDWKKEIINSPVNYKAEFKQDKTSLIVKDVTITVGDKWNPRDGFISATNADGEKVNFLEISFSGTVDTSKSGTYKVTYRYGNLSKVIRVTVKEKAIPTYRLYNKNTGEHFYTQSVYERDSLKRVGWNDEGIGWKAPASGSPVYRLYNPNAKGGDHYYTVSKYEANSLVKVGWRWDNNGKPAFYSGGNVKVYVAYNPNAQSGAHNYTTSKFEQDSLLKIGWKYGEVAWYALN